MNKIVKFCQKKPGKKQEKNLRTVMQTLRNSKKQWSLGQILFAYAAIVAVHIDKGGIVIQPGLKYELYHYTMVHFDYILSGVQISTIADFSSMHSGEFCPLLQISTFACLFPYYH